MLFRKKIDSACVYCARGRAINDTELVCRKHGIVEPWWHCRAFKYDPYKREPPHPPSLKQVYIDPEPLEPEPPAVYGPPRPPGPIITIYPSANG